MEFASSSKVELVDKMGSDVKVAAAARNSISLKSAMKLYEEDDNENKSVVGLIRSLMKKRHGVPFEHCVFTFAIDQPIFNWREFMRHRMASYSEASARYRPLRPKFYIPPAHRPMKPILGFKPMEPEFDPLDDATYAVFTEELRRQFSSQWAAYEQFQRMGIALEVSRSVIGTGVFSSAWVTVNLRSLMNLLSLRVKDLTAREISYPQWEINQVANTLEEVFANEFPRVHEFFVEVGRRAP